MKKIPFSPPDIGEEEINNVIEALRSGWITTGPKTKQFESMIAEYCGTRKAACLNSATAGLELILRILGVGKGDEVITSAYTYTASASVIDHVGAKIVLCDIADDSFEMDYAAMADLINEKTKAIIAVDIGGIICDYDKIYDAVNCKRGIFKPGNALQEKLGRVAVIADAAHSFGAVRDGRKSGAVADFSSFSFHAVKNLTTAEGGAVVWKSDLGLDDETIYKSFMLWSLHGQSKDALTKSQIGSWEYDIELLGEKCNMTDIAAALGIAQLNRYSAILDRRKKIIKLYDKIIGDKNIFTANHFGCAHSSSGHLYLTLIGGINESTRNKIIIKLAENGISSNVHYKPLPMFTAYKKLGFDITDFPKAYEKYRKEITLPLHTLLTDDDVIYIAENFTNIVEIFRGGR